MPPPNAAKANWSSEFFVKLSQDLGEEVLKQSKSCRKQDRSLARSNKPSDVAQPPSADSQRGLKDLTSGNVSCSVRARVDDKNPPPPGMVKIFDESSNTSTLLSYQEFISGKGVAGSIGDGQVRREYVKDIVNGQSNGLISYSPPPPPPPEGFVRTPFGNVTIHDFISKDEYKVYGSVSERAQLAIDSEGVIGKPPKDVMLLYGDTVRFAPAYEEGTLAEKALAKGGPLLHATYANGNYTGASKMVGSKPYVEIVYGEPRQTLWVPYATVSKIDKQ